MAPLPYQQSGLYQQSKLLWIGGGLLGAVIGYAATRRAKETLLSGALGSILLGAVGDKVLEQHQRTGVWSLMPIH